mgnify:CR=1 FL=1
MKKWLFAFSMAGLLALTGCSRPAPEEETSPAETETVEEAPVEEETSGIKVIENVGPDKNRTVSLRIVDENNPALLEGKREGTWNLYFRPYGWKVRSCSRIF